MQIAAIFSCVAPLKCKRLDLKVGFLTERKNVICVVACKHLHTLFYASIGLWMHAIELD